MSTRAATILLMLLALPAPGLAQATAEALAAPPDLAVDLTTASIVTGSEVTVLAGTLLLKDYLSVENCRWCTPPQFDVWGREQLKWQNTQAAETGSNVLQLAIPAGTMATLWIWAAPHGQRQVVEDLLVVTEAATTTMLMTQVVKYGSARLRPYAWARGGTDSGSGRPDDIMSFWSGHTSFVFAVAAASTQVARLRGRPGWKWLAALGFAGAAVTGYLRIAADQHWLTDVVTGAAVGTTVGLVLPLMVLRPAGGNRPAVTLAPAPGGLAIVF